MTGRPNVMLRTSKLFRETESEPRTTELNRQALKKSLAKLEGYVATRPAMEREGDFGLWSDQWMR